MQTTDNILTIDEDLIAGVRSPNERDLPLDPCTNREPTEKTPEATTGFEIETETVATVEPLTPAP